MKARRSRSPLLQVQRVHRREMSQRAGDRAKDRADGQSDIAQLADAPPDGLGYNSLGAVRSRCVWHIVSQKLKCGG
jgi:hypothetical protein